MTSTAHTRTYPIGRLMVLAIPAGLIGELIFEIVALGAMPALLGTPMKPALLVAGLSRTLAGIELPMTWAWAVHLFAGVAAFPVGYVAFRRLANIRSWAVAGIVWGVLLWLLAQAILAPLAGRPFMLGFIAYTWAALVVHIIYTMTTAYALESMARRVGNRSLAPAR